MKHYHMFWAPAKPQLRGGGGGPKPCFSSGQVHPYIAHTLRHRNRKTWQRCGNLGNGVYWLGMRDLFNGPSPSFWGGGGVSRCVVLWVWLHCRKGDEGEIWENISEGQLTDSQFDKLVHQSARQPSGVRGRVVVAINNLHVLMFFLNI